MLLWAVGTQWAVQHCPVLGRLWHLSQVVVRAAHDSGIGDDARGCWVEARKVKIILDQNGTRWRLIEGHLRVRDPLQVVWVGLRGKGGGQAAGTRRSAHHVPASRVKGVLHTAQGGVF